jgi:glycosyltransferase involved in cell wall biosynthesis
MGCRKALASVEVRILFLTGSRTDPSSRFRVWQFAGPLTALGHQVTVRVPFPSRTWQPRDSSFLPARLLQAFGSLLRVASVLWNLRQVVGYDVIMMNRDLVPETRVGFLEPWLARRNPRLIFDFDDAIHIGVRQKKLRRILPHFAWIISGNRYLADFVRELHMNVSIWPTVVNTDVYVPASNRTPGPIRVGWSGSVSTAQHCLPLLEKPLCKLATTVQFEFLVISNSDPCLQWNGVKTRYIPWTAETEVRGLQELDLGLMPLRDAPFERGKCGLKAVQYMGVGIPALVSPVGVNQEIIVHGITGYHCSNDTDWVERIQQLIRDETLRKSMRAAARNRVANVYSVQALLPTMQAVFAKVAQMGRER